jgi:hypothetical protein
MAVLRTLHRQAVGAGHPAASGGAANLDGLLGDRCVRRLLEVPSWNAKMNNPNPSYNNGPAADPWEDFDFESYIDHVFSELAVRGTQIQRWFEAKQFVDVKIRMVPHRGPNSWECLMLRREKEKSPTWEEVQALVVELAGDLRKRFELNEFCAVVWGDRIGMHFRLRSLAV